MATPYKWHKTLHLVLHNKPDFIILTETGNTTSANVLRWALPDMREGELDNESSTEAMAQRQLQFPYTIHVTTGTEEGTRGGIIMLIHKDWTHRKVGTPYTPTHKRWTDHILHTPSGIVHMIGTYGRPGPEHDTRGTKEWHDLQTYIEKQHAKGHWAILAGDNNISRNTPATRQHTDTQPATQQHQLLTGMEYTGGMTDTFHHLHGANTQYYTHITTRKTWTSPDHIFISDHQTHRILSCQNDHTPITDGHSDHTQISCTIQLDAPITISFPKHKKQHSTLKKHRSTRMRSNSH